MEGVALPTRHRLALPVHGYLGAALSLLSLSVPASAHAQPNSGIVIHNAPLSAYDSLDIYLGASYSLFPFGPFAYQGGVAINMGDEGYPFALSLFSDPNLLQYSELPRAGWAAFLLEEQPGDDDADPLDVVQMTLFPRPFRNDSIGVLFVNGSPDMPEVDLVNTSTGAVLARGVAYQTGRFFTIAPGTVDDPWIQLTITRHDEVRTPIGTFAFERAPSIAGQSWALSTSGYMQQPHSISHPLRVLGTNLYVVHLIDFSQRTAREPEEAPTTFLLAPAYPNPFNPTTQFMLRVDQPQDVRLSVFDAWGREVQRIHTGVLVAGTHPFTFNAGGLPSGPYMIRAQGHLASQMHPVTLVK